ncbi:MAG: SUMF1/EgtB/PvdO family nonheme iron enzyme [Treponema sp.]|nr:SUMF1/EgtB/PvdO family nonheme iron enzyme [Treponema sp.]
MRNRLLIGFSILVLLFTTACENPFFPEKRGRENPNIISVSVTPDSANIITGGVMQFSAAVANSSNQNVTWSITGDNIHTDTEISADGLLKVSDDETIGVEIIVTAVSDANKTKSGSAVVTVIDKTIYSIVIDYRDDETGDTVTANPAEGFEGKEITLNYNVINNGKINNRLHFSGTNEKIDDVTSAGSGTRTYIIDPEDAIDSVIIIIATFTHTDLTIDEISFADSSPIVVKTYGDAPFTNAVKAGHLGTGAITYSSDDEDVASVNNSGVVTIKKAGSAVITAEKAADAVYAHASASYTLDVEHKTLTITGVTGVDRDFIFENTTVAITGGTLVGVVGGDNVSAIVPSTGTMTNANAGNAKPVTTAITLTGSDSGNYSLTQPVVTVNINKVDPVVVWPVGLTAIENFPLGNIPLPGNGTGTPTGVFTWVTPTASAGISGTKAFSMSFTPNDTTNYNTLTQSVNVLVRTVGADIAANMEEIIGDTSRSFQMGQNGDGSSGNANPIHTVTLTQSFSMSKHQVTQEQYMAVMGNNPSYFNGESTGIVDNISREPAEREIQGKRPVEMVSWYEAIIFCNRLSILEGLTPAYSISESTDPDVWGTVPTSSNTTWNAVIILAGSTGYRLPTEAQWEYAAKGGHLSNNYIYSGSNNIDEVAWYFENSNSMTHQVGLKKPNELGLYDMSGNVSEWCWDWYGSYPAGAETDPMGASSGSFRMVRGGGWGNSVLNARSVDRQECENPYYGSFFFGFRLLRP